MLNDWTERLADTGGANDDHRLPITEKQLAFAKSIAARTGQSLPDAARSDRRSLSAWIETHKAARGHFEVCDLSEFETGAVCRGAGAAEAQRDPP